MNLLLDTQVLVWSIIDLGRFTERSRAAISNRENGVWVSSISLWEIEIKSQIGKLQMPVKWREAMTEQGFLFLAFDTGHAYATSELPLHHKDPFDRALLAQTRAERFHLMSADRTVWRYEADVNIFKC